MTTAAGRLRSAEKMPLAGNSHKCSLKSTRNRSGCSDRNRSGRSDRSCCLSVSCSSFVRLPHSDSYRTSHDGFLGSSPSRPYKGAHTQAIRSIAESSSRHPRCHSCGTPHRDTCGRTRGGPSGGRCGHCCGGSRGHPNSQLYGTIHSRFCRKTDRRPHGAFQEKPRSHLRGGTDERPGGWFQGKPRSGHCGAFR